MKSVLQFLEGEACVRTGGHETHYAFILYILCEHNTKMRIVSK